MTEQDYPIQVWWSAEDRSWLACAPDLKGCIAHGDSAAAALAELQVAERLWIRTQTEAGLPLPTPRHIEIPV